MNIDKTYFVGFNLTATDWLNTNETEEEAQKDLGGTRYWVTKKEGSEAYTFEGKGNYAEGPIVDILAIEMPPEELAILADSPRYTSISADTLKGGGNSYVVDQSHFKDCFLQLLNALLIQNDSTPANVAIAYVNMLAPLEALKNLDFDNTYLSMSSVVLGGSLTAEIKTDLTNFVSDYIKKYPR